MTNDEEQIRGLIKHIKDNCDLITKSIDFPLTFKGVDLVLKGEEICNDSAVLLDFILAYDKYNG